MLYSYATRDIRLLARCKLGIRSSSMLRIVYWQLVTDVSGQSIGPILRDQEFYLAQVLNNAVDVLCSRFSVISAGGVQMCRTP